MRNTKALTTLSVIVLLVLGSIVYYTWPKLTNESKNPPVLSISGNTLQGLLTDPSGFFEFSEEEIEDADDCDENIVEISSGTHFYYLTNKTDLDELIGYIHPTDGNRLLFAFYSPGEETPGLEKGFHVYPAGGTENVTIEDTAEFDILPYRTFVLHATEETKFCDAEDLIKLETQASDKIKLLKNNEKGWIQIPAFATSESTLSALGDDIDRVESIWLQDNENSFKKDATLDDLELVQGYYVMWIYLNEKQSVS